MKKIFKKSIIYTLIGSMLLGDTMPVLAANSIEDIKYTNAIKNSTPQTSVYAELGSEFKVIIPKKLTLDGSTKTGIYTVTCEGDIAGYETLKVIPDNSFILSSTNLNDVTATIIQDKTEWSYDEILTDNKIIGNGSINAAGISAGSWNGSFNFNICLDGITQTPATTYDATFANNTWQQIATACQNDEVPATWNVGDIKTMQVGEETYEVAIIGKNHDTYADNSGTAPLTFQLVDVLNTTYQMNSTNTNAGGWDGSALYTTLNTTIFDTLEADVKDNIKAVFKTTNIGDVDSGNATATTTRTTSDKLFLLSPTEVFNCSSNTNVLKDEGTQYEYYVTEANIIKTTTAGVASFWWLRSPYYNGSRHFYSVNTSGSYINYTASNSYCVAFGFCF